MACQVKMGYLGHLDHQVTKGAEESKDMLGHKVRMEHDCWEEMCEVMHRSVFFLLPQFPQGYSTSSLRFHDTSCPLSVQALTVSFVNNFITRPVGIKCISAFSVKQKDN